MFCIRCGKRIDYDAALCHECDDIVKFEKEKKSEPKATIILMAVLLFLLLVLCIGLVIGLINRAKSQNASSKETEDLVTENDSTEQNGQEDEIAVHDGQPMPTDWKSAYLKYAEEYLEENRDELRERYEYLGWDETYVLFGLVYVDDDEIPELLVTPDAPFIYDMEGGLYSYIDGSLKCLVSINLPENSSYAWFIHNFIFEKNSGNFCVLHQGDGDKMQYTKYRFENGELYEMDNYLSFNTYDYSGDNVLYDTYQERAGQIWDEYPDRVEMMSYDELKKELSEINESVLKKEENTVPIDSVRAKEEFKKFFYDNYSNADIAFLADVTHDGLIDLIVIHKASEYSYSGHVYTVSSGKVKEIYTNGGGTDHAGGFYNWYVAERKDGWDLGEEYFGMWQGMGETNFSEYYLSEDGKRIDVDVVSVAWDGVDPVEDEDYDQYTQDEGQMKSDFLALFCSFDDHAVMAETDPATVFGR